MYSTTEATASNKRAALEQLRFSKKQQSSRINPSNLSLSTLGGPSQVPYAQPPSQSRDATVASRFFPSTPSSMGTVLVPSSSPLAPDGLQRRYQPYGQPHGHDVAPIAGLAHPNHPWAPSRTPFGMDLLSAPSGFVSNGASNHASLRRPRGGDDKHIDSGEENGPPRKRLNRGPSQDASDSQNSPHSPDIQRPGQRRRLVSDRIDALSISSEDSLPDVSNLMASSSKSRIIRGRPDMPSDINEIPGDDSKFIRFKLTMPTESPSRIQAAWAQAQGDVKKATELLSDFTWVPKSPSTTKSSAEDMGRVKEIDEATRARRVAAKEKGKRSMIYANRPILETQPSPRASPPISKTAVEPPSPAVTASPVLPRRKRAKRLAVDSESELEIDTDSDKEGDRSPQDSAGDTRVLDYFNTSGPEALQELTGCTPEQANTIIDLRPFDSILELNEKLGQGKKKAGPAGISPRMFEDCKTIFEGYGAVDNILEDCEKIGVTLRAAIASWSTKEPTGKGKAKEGGCDSPLIEDAEDGALSLRSLSSLNGRPKDYLTAQPSLLANTVQLKEYQLLGVNWLNLLYCRRLSCILADEMGLGKTIQVISFFAFLKEQGKLGPHLIVVPSSTLENWCREFARFAPSISVQTYYAGKEERVGLRQTLLDSQRCKSSSGKGWEVLITTYNLAQGDDRDRKFFRRIDWDSCVYDEGHVLKNFQSQRYQSLLKFGSKWRLLLTGTPLQNNLQELVSLMNFILPHHFAETIDSLRAIFKVKGDSKVTLLAQERVSRAKKMMTPFVLRRRKDQVLKDLPKKEERIEWCEMTPLQLSIYNDALQRSRKVILVEDSKVSEDATPHQPKGKPAASHPMLFRRRFTNDILSGITKQLLKEPDFRKRGALFDLVKEDMSVMTDAELQIFCATYKSTRKYLQDEECYLEAGKIQMLLTLLEKYGKEQRKMLIFSQFTQILDILQAVLKNKRIQYLLLTGSTPVDVRQTLVDEFTEDDSIPVFLLSTKAGGMGINLTAASVVIMFDQDFNPHNDRQAQDRAYRIGQKRDVEVVKLISRGTIEEDMLKLGETKLALDEAVAGDSEGKGDGESAPEREMKTSLMKVLRQQFERQQGAAGDIP
ncbi:SNF2 family N-terminal domain-containing protein [Infundibulicybe gibba]|nr:SNF2 family N-terminal domain-containing protein [Infundibulicybe gibba]